MQTSKDLVRAARRETQSLSPERVARELSAGDVVLVDVREVDEVRVRGVIPGALHVPRGMLEFRADPAHPLYLPALRPDRRLVVYCESGDRSALAARVLHEMGYRDVAHLDGGLDAWREAHFATTLDVALDDGKDRAPARPGRGRPKSGVAASAVGVAIAAVATIVALANVVGGGDAPVRPQSTPTAVTTALQDPLITRFGEDPECAQLRTLRADPLISRFGQPADTTGLRCAP